MEDASAIFPHPLSQVLVTALHCIPANYPHELRRTKTAQCGGSEAQPQLHTCNGETRRFASAPAPQTTSSASEENKTTQWVEDSWDEHGRKRIKEIRREDEKEGNVEERRVLSVEATGGSSVPSVKSLLMRGIKTLFTNRVMILISIKRFRKLLWALNCMQNKSFTFANWILHSSEHTCYLDKQQYVLASIQQISHHI